MTTITKPSETSTIEIKICIDGKFYLQHVSHHKLIDDSLRSLVASGVYRGISEMMDHQYGIKFGENYE